MQVLINPCYTQTDEYKTISIPIRGLSDVIGMMADTVLRNIVSDKRIVTPDSGKPGVWLKL